MTARKTKASTREIHPPCGNLVNAEDRYTPSMNQKNRRKQVARTMLLCHTKIMTSVVRNVVTNILVMQARPERKRYHMRKQQRIIKKAKLE